MNSSVISGLRRDRHNFTDIIIAAFPRSVKPYSEDGVNEISVTDGGLSRRKNALGYMSSCEPSPVDAASHVLPARLTPP